jgi:hypothetical protein
MIKKLGGVSLIYILMMCLTGFTSCNYNRRPAINDHEIWICEEPFAYFTWGGGDVGFVGEIFVGETLYKYQFRIDLSGGAVLIVPEKGVNRNNWTSLLSGSCRFSKNKVVMKISKNSHAVYRNDYDKLIFERHEFDPEKDEKPKPGANGK